MDIPHSHLLLLCVSAWCGACRPDSAASQQEKNEQLKSAEAVVPPEPARALPEVHLSQRNSADIVLVVDGSGQLCADLLRWPNRPVHVVCDAGPADPAGNVLQAGLTELRRQVGQPLSRRKVVLLGGPDRGPDVRALVTRDPAFFSRAALWTEGDRKLIDLFGPTYLDVVAPRGAQMLYLLGAEEKEYAPWIRLARRAGMELAVGDRDLAARAAVTRLLEVHEPAGKSPPAPEQPVVPGLR